MSYFTQKHARRMNKRIETIPADAMQALCGYVWPGNVRELENVLERAVILSPGPELQVALPELSPNAAVIPAEARRVRNMNLEDAERAHILHVLRDTNWIIGGPRGAASKLGLNRSTLRSKMIKLGIDRPS